MGDLALAVGAGCRGWLSGPAATTQGMTATATEHGLLDPLTEAQVQLRRWAPSDAGARVVERFWTLRFDVTGSAVQPVLPHPCVNVAFGSADPGVHGPLRARDDHRIAGRGWVVAAKLRPGALVAMGLADGPGLVDARRPVPEVFGLTGARVVQAVHDGIGDGAAAELIEGMLLERSVDDARWPALLEVIAAVLADRAIVRVRQLAASSGWSVRTLERWFTHYLGLSPAWVLARYRLQDAAHALAGGDGVELADLSARLGYYDQAHFTRAFTAAVGLPPGAYARWCSARVAMAGGAEAGEHAGVKAG